MEANQPVTSILDTVQRDCLRSPDTGLQDYGAALTSKDILCVIADLTDAATYDFYDLSIYRGVDCASVSSADHEANEQAATQNRQMVRIGAY